MPDILKIHSNLFNVSIWTKDILYAQKRYSKTLASRNEAQNIAEIKFAPQLKQVDIFEGVLKVKSAIEVDKFFLSAPIFFENKSYEFDFDFSKSGFMPKGVKHPLRSVEDSFRVVGSPLRGTINFGNDIGWFTLKIIFTSDSSNDIQQLISFEVYPTKLVMHSDLKEMHNKIDAEYPLWTLSFAKKTDHLFGRIKKSQPRFDIVWLANFSSLRSDLEIAIKSVAVNPHSRLMPFARKVSLEKIKSRISGGLEEKIFEDISRYKFDKRYLVKKKKLSFNTPENQFLKMVLTRTSNELLQFQERLKENYGIDSDSAISASFILEISNWRRPLEEFLNRPFLSEVSVFSGLIGESLVLQQQTGYAKIYQVWQELKLYLELFGGVTSMSMKSVSDLYEVWCLLEIKNLLHDLGFEDTGLVGKKVINRGIEKSFSLSHFAAFCLKRCDGVEVNIYHEPTFKAPNKKNQQGIFSFTTKQIPDIFIEVIFSTGEKLCWIFDAKYRISDDSDDQDLIPEDAINQMHRYRDALIRLFNEDAIGEERKSRPIYGAYVLYPGWFDQSHGYNPYEKSNLDVGIGGFPLVPGKDNIWLAQFFKDIFGESPIQYEYKRNPDLYFVDSPLRIGPSGLNLTRCKDLTLALNLVELKEDISIDLPQLNNGLPLDVFIPLSVFRALRLNFSDSIIQELRWLAFATSQLDDLNSKIDCLYSIRNAKYSNVDNVDGVIFVVDYFLPLKASLRVSNQSYLKALYANASEILSAVEWEDLSKKYY